MIWSTSNIPCPGNPCSCTKKQVIRNDKIDSILDDKIIPYSSPYYRNNHNIRASNIKFEYTDGEMLSLAKSYNDINYFAELARIQLGEYQQRVLSDLSKNRFNLIVNSQQSGMKYLICLSILHFALKCDGNILIISHNNESVNNILNSIKDIYQKLPFYLKPGVKLWKSNSIQFENGTFIECSTSNRHSLSRQYDYVLMDNFAYYTNRSVDFLYRSIIQTIGSRIKSKLVICSIPNGDNHFKEILEEDNNFFKTKIHWSEIPGRDEEWKKNMIQMVGVECFAQEFENLLKGTKEWNRYINLHKLTE